MLEGAEVRLAVDIGGTFTDIVLDVGQDRKTRKVLTTPQRPEQAVLDGMRLILADARAHISDIDVFIHGTTLATNAIIERRGAKTALVATEGFRDVLDIGTESRYDQHDLSIDKPKPLAPRSLRFTVPERVDAHGAVRLPLDEAAVRALAPALRTLNVESVAFAFLHSYVNPAHEQRTAEILKGAMPGLSITLSSEVCPEIREYERTSTAVANAYVQPLMDGYLARMDDALRVEQFRGAIYLVTSGGGLTSIDTARRFPVRLVESGPAGGAIFAAQVAARCAERKVLSFDMGGTTAKICLIENFEPNSARVYEVDRAARFLKGSGLPLRIPVIEMVEIGAGGGSLAGVDPMKRITVGPESAGSDPGPACYRLGGARPAVTDANVVLGRIDPDRFAGGSIQLEAALSRQALDTHIGGPLDLDTTLSAFGVSEVVEENMANAARVHAVERGAELEGRTLIAFGGGAPLHAARLAEKLGIADVLIPASAGVGSAVGFLRAPIAFEVVRSRFVRLSAFDPAAINAMFAEMAKEAADVVKLGAGSAPIRISRSADMRYAGQGHEILVELPDGPFTGESVAELQKRFDAGYRALFNRVIPALDIEVVGWILKAEAPAPGRAAALPMAAAGEGGAPAAVGTRTLFDPMLREFASVSVYARAALKPGQSIQGPAVIAEDETTTIITSGFTATLDPSGAIRLLARKAVLQEAAQ